MDGFVNRSSLNELEEYLEQSEKIGEGMNSVAYLSPRMEVVKLSEYDPMVFDEIEEIQKISDIDGLPATRVSVEDLEDHGFWFNTLMEVQRYSNISHEEGIGLYGAEKTAEMTSLMWTNLRDQGFRYRDLKPANINFFREGYVYLIKPVDFLDKSAYTYEEDINTDSYKEAKPFDLYILGNDMEDGLIDIADISVGDAIRSVLKGSRLMSEDIEITGDPFYDIRKAFEKR